eukprot:Gb_09088 [translate_table: standard]
MEDALRSPLFGENEEIRNGDWIRSSHDVLALDSQSAFNPRQPCKESWIESKKLWYIAGPAIFTAICQYSLGAVTQTFAGHLGTIELAAVAIENSVIAGLAFGTMLGMGSALETLCGQAYGAGQIHMLGVYMQRSWVILNGTSLVLSLVYIFAPPILKLFGQSDEISDLSGKFAIWMLPQLFAYAMNFPMQKFLQSQSKVWAMAWISALALILHVFLSWLCIMKLGWGLAGAAITLNLSWWIVVLGQLAYILSGTCPGAWTGFSWLAFRDLAAFVRLSLASAVMLCLEFWYLMILIVLTGHLKNPEIAVDSISICMNLNGWEAMISIGFNAAISVRVSNELGAGQPKAAKFAVVVVTLTSLAIGILLMAVVFVTKNDFPVLFTNSHEVMKAVSELATLLGLTMLLNSVQPVLSGVAVGAGWQALVAYVNIGCYYVIGVPLGALLGYKLNYGAKGIWGGMLGGTVLQTLILLFITYRTDWNREALEAGDRIKVWGGSVEAIKDGSVKVASD